MDNYLDLCADCAHVIGREDQPSLWMCRATKRDQPFALYFLTGNLPGTCMDMCLKIRKMTGERCPKFQRKTSEESKG